MRLLSRLIACLGPLALAACTTIPDGPEVEVMPAPGKSFEVFAAEDARCREWARGRAGSAEQTDTRRAMEAAAVGTAVGAAAGAMIGHGEGDAIATGAGTGLLVGAAGGLDHGGHAAERVQRRYDMAYRQCMYAAGNQVPGYPR